MLQQNLEAIYEKIERGIAAQHRWPDICALHLVWANLKQWYDRNIHCDQ